MIYDLESVNIADYEDSFHYYEFEEPNINIEFEPLIMPYSNYTFFSDYLSTSSFLKDVIEKSSVETREKLIEMLTSLDKDSSQYFSLKPEKSFETSSGEPSST